MNHHLRYEWSSASSNMQYNTCIPHKLHSPPLNPPPLNHSLLAQRMSKPYLDFIRPLLGPIFWSESSLAIWVKQCFIKHAIQYMHSSQTPFPPLNPPPLNHSLLAQRMSKPYLDFIRPLLGPIFWSESSLAIWVKQCFIKYAIQYMIVWGENLNVWNLDFPQYRILFAIL